MGVDASIYNALGTRPRSVADFDMDAMKVQEGRQGLQQNALNLQLGQQKMQEYQRGLQESNALRDYLGSGAKLDTPEGQQGLYRAAPTLAGKVLGDFAERQKTGAETGYKTAQTGEVKQKTDQERVRFALQGLAAANDPRSATMVGLQSGLIQPEQASEYFGKIPQDPAGFAQWKRQQMMSGVDLAKQFDIQQAAQNAAETGRHNVSTEGLTARGQNMTQSTAMRGQNMVDARSKQALDTPQYMETDSGLVALPKKLAPGQSPTGTPVLMADGTPLSKPLKDIPATANTAIISNGQSLKKIQQALDLVGGKNIGDPAKGGATGDAEATGMKGYLFNGLLNRVDPKGVETRALISDIGSLKIHDRSGAAVTVSESPRLMPFIPLATDDSATVTKKLNSLRREVEGEAQALGDTYSKANGYKVKPAAAASGNLTAAEAAELAALRNRFGRK